MNSNSIIIACRKLPDMTHARITPSHASLFIQYGRVSIGKFFAYDKETLSFADNQELLEIWDGVCWNIPGLAAFVAHLDCYDCASKVAV